MKTPFNKLSKKDQVVAIAKDVIEQIRLSRYNPQSGWYIKDLQLDGETIDSFGTAMDLDIQSNFEKITSCDVCAMGACLLSATKFKNVLKFKDTNGCLGSENNKKLFASLFTPKQLLLIESAFEGDASGISVADSLFDYTKLTTTEKNKCADFHDNYVGDSMRMVAIMENIITNKGTFKP